MAPTRMSKRFLSTNRPAHRSPSKIPSTPSGARGRGVNRPQRIFEVHPQVADAIRGDATTSGVRASGGEAVVGDGSVIIFYCIISFQRGIFAEHIPQLRYSARETYWSVLLTFVKSALPRLPHFECPSELGTGGHPASSGGRKPKGAFMARIETHGLLVDTDQQSLFYRCSCFLKAS